ncbi:MAG: hypothetical protein QOG57_5215, partial [Pseudonocardiales bacterium]|nr:hypothetical protein [Pseudonocardiales bacterium]
GTNPAGVPQAVTALRAALRDGGAAAGARASG